jgi:MFS family permease
MLLAFALGILTITELVQIWHVLFIATSLGVVNAFDTPARQAFTVELVGREDLANAIALNSSMFNGARIIGPAIAGVIISIPQIGLGGAFLLNGVSFLAVIAGLLAIRVPRPTHLAIGGDPLRGMTAGLRYLHRRRDLSTIMLLIMIVSIFGFSYTTLLPIFARDVLHIGAAGQGAMMTTVGAGALLAALSLASQGRQGKKGLRFTIGNTLLPLMLLVLAVSRWVPLSFAAIFVVGWAFITQNATSNTLIQTNVPDHLRGRVMSVWTITVMGMTPFGSLWAGTLASAIGAPAALAVGAMVCLVGSLVALWHVPEVRRMD